jgi:HSP20 family protein
VPWRGPRVRPAGIESLEAASIINDSLVAEGGEAVTALALWRPKRGLARRGPARDFVREVDDLFERLFGDWTWRWDGGSVGSAPAVDMLDRRNEVILRVDVPGLREKDITVNVSNGVLTICGARKEEREEHDEDYYCAERWTGAFSRSVTLPSGIDADGIKATLKHGVLEIRLPKTKDAAAKWIEVKAA